MSVEESTILVALIVAMGPTLAIVATAYAAHRRQQEDYRRQDQVAERAQEAADELVKRQDTSELRAHEVAEQAAQAADLLLAANERVARATSEAAIHASAVEAKIDQIHGLVNSTLTASMMAQATALEQLIDLMDDLSLQVGPNEHARSRRETAAEQLAVLHQDIADREHATEMAEEQLHADRPPA